MNGWVATEHGKGDAILDDITALMSNTITCAGPAGCLSIQGAPDEVAQTRYATAIETRYK